MSKQRDELLRLADFLVEDILAMSDEEIIAESDPAVDAAFWCDCGRPFSQVTETEERERSAGMCTFCLETALAGHWRGNERMR